MVHPSRGAAWSILQRLRFSHDFTCLPSVDKAIQETRKVRQPSRWSPRCRTQYANTTTQAARPDEKNQSQELSGLASAGSRNLLQVVGKPRVYPPADPRGWMTNKKQRFEGSAARFLDRFYNNNNFIHLTTQPRPSPAEPGMEACRAEAC